MGRNITGATAYDPITATVVGEAIAYGDWVRVETSGLVRRVAEGIPLASNNTAQGATAVVGVPALAHVAESNYGGSPSSARILAVLGNGNVAALHTGNGTTANTALTCRIYTPANARLTSVQVTAGTSVGSFRVVKLNSANFAVAWSESDVLKLAVFSNAGAVVAAATTVAQMGGSDFSRWNMAALVNGDVVVAYDKIGAGGVCFARFNAAGVLQGVETSIEAGTATNFVCVLPLAAGGHLVYYARSTATTAYKFARYNAAGVLQGVLTTVATGPAGALAVEFSEFGAIELSNGNIVVIDPSSTTTSAVRLYDSNGTYISTVVNYANAGAYASVRTAIKAKSGGGFYVSMIAGYIRYVSNAGAILQTASSINLGSTSCSHMIIDRPGAGPLAWGAGYYYNGESYSSSVNALAFDSQLVQEGALLSLSISSSPFYGNWAEMMPCGLVAYTYCHPSVTGTSLVGRISPQGASLLGVAVSAGVEGQSISAATLGRWKTNQSYPSMSFDRRSASPVGAKALVVGGNLVVLSGVVS